MNIEYICHASLLIETADLRIATDPWFAGPANCRQWYVFPKPVNQDKIRDVEAIFISHGHEDHLHEESLRQMPKDAVVYYPYSFFGGAKEYIESLGFGTVNEAVTFRKLSVSSETTVTFILNSHDSIIVVESGGQVLVNINDALHSYPEKVINYYVDAINQRWPKIDYVFCGFGGSSYFPNTMHISGKDDIEIGLAREQLFVHNFCKIVHDLNPRIAVPFAADFVLLDDSQRWINEVRFPRTKIGEYYEKYFSNGEDGPVIHVMFSGDRIEEGELVQSSPYHLDLTDGDLAHLIEEQYASEIGEREHVRTVDEAKAEQLVEKIAANVRKRMTLYKHGELKDLKFLLHLTDVVERFYYHIEFDRGEPRVWRSESPDDDFLLTMKLSSEVLEYAIGSDWGADVISVGYGAEIYVSDDKAAFVDMERVCMNLLACYPTVSEWKNAPLRTLQFLLLGPPKFTTSIRKLKKFNLESENYDRKVWLLYNGCEIRKRYHLPELEPGFVPRFVAQHGAGRSRTSTAARP